MVVDYSDNMITNLRKTSTDKILRGVIYMYDKRNSQIFQKLNINEKNRINSEIKYQHQLIQIKHQISYFILFQFFINMSFIFYTSCELNMNIDFENTKKYLINNYYIILSSKYIITLVKFVKNIFKT